MTKSLSLAYFFLKLEITKSQEVWAGKLLSQGIFNKTLLSTEIGWPSHWVPVVITKKSACPCPIFAIFVGYSGEENMVDVIFLALRGSLHQISNKVH